MARVEIVAAGEDKERADTLAGFLRTRGYVVWGEVGKPGVVPVAPDLVVVVVWSHQTAFSAQRMAIERRALDAWAEGRLVLVRLDVHAAAVGLRDLPAVELWRTVEMVGFEEVARAVRAALAPVLRAPGGAGGGGEAGGEDRGEDDVVTDRRPAPPPEPSAPSEHAPARSAGGGGMLVVAAAAVLGGAAAIAWWFGTPVAAVAGGGLAVVGVAVVFALALSGRSASRSAPPQVERKAARPSPAREEVATEAPAAPRAPAQPAPAPAASAPPTLDLLLPESFLFVSYAHADKPRVADVIDATRAVGKEVWTDAKLPVGDGWAGEIVRALKAAEAVIVCCSTDAFESDHVKREVYLADRFKKRLLPVFLEKVEPPDDFLYFFADRQWLIATQVGPEELQAKLAAALG